MQTSCRRYRVFNKKSKSIKPVLKLQSEVILKQWLLIEINNYFVPYCFELHFVAKSKTIKWNIIFLSMSCGSLCQRRISVWLNLSYILYYSVGWENHVSTNFNNPYNLYLDFPIECTHNPLMEGIHVLLRAKWKEKNWLPFTQAVAEVYLHRAGIPTLPLTYSNIKCISLGKCCLPVRQPVSIKDMLVRVVAPLALSLHG